MESTQEYSCSISWQFCQEQGTTYSALYTKFTRIIKFPLTISLETSALRCYLLPLWSALVPDSWQTPLVFHSGKSKSAHSDKVFQQYEPLISLALTNSFFLLAWLSSVSGSSVEDFLLLESGFSTTPFCDSRKAAISSGQSRFSSGSQVLSELKKTLKCFVREKHRSEQMYLATAPEWQKTAVVHLLKTMGAYSISTRLTPLYPPPLIYTENISYPSAN